MTAIGSKDRTGAPNGTYAAARTVLFYTGEPHPTNFEERLRSIFGNGAEVILATVRKRL